MNQWKKIALELAVMRKATVELRKAEGYFLNSDLTIEDKVTLLEDVKYFAGQAYKASVKVQKLLKALRDSMKNYLRSF